jgi:hypothetical protein
MLSQVLVFLCGKTGIRENLGTSRGILAALIIPPHGSTWETIRLFLRRDTARRGDRPVVPTPDSKDCPSTNLEMIQLFLHF